MSDSTLEQKTSSLQFCALGIQHLLAMFGSTVLVPLITGMSPSAALFAAGIGTLVFHLCTKGIVPVFLGSSFAFIGALSAIIKAKGIPAAQSGIMAAGVVYLIFALIAKLVGPNAIRKIFPPVVTGPIVIIIGLSLTGVGVSDAFGKFESGAFALQNGINMGIAVITFLIVTLGMVQKKGIYKLIPILIGILIGYALCVILDFCGVYEMKYDAIAAAPWFNIPFQTEGFLSLPKWDWEAVLLIAPISIVTFMEHLGDITTNGAVVGKDFFKDPGVHRTLMGDGLATMVAGLIGGPCNTTYSENTGVLATTKNYNPALLRLAAIFAIILGLLGKFGASLQTIPVPVKGGIELVLFGMIASVGIRTISDAKLDLSSNRNMAIMAGILCVGVGLNGIGGLPIKVCGMTITLSALFVATIVGAILNAVLPESLDKKDAEKSECHCGCDCKKED